MAVKKKEQEKNHTGVPGFSGINKAQYEEPLTADLLKAYMRHLKKTRGSKRRRCLSAEVYRLMVS